MEAFHQTTDPQMHHRVVLSLPTSRAAYPPHLHSLLERTLASAQAHPDERIRDWATAVAHQEV